MDHPILLHKPVGLTPYQAIQRFKYQHPDLAESKIAAAGRLDPMAEGLLLLLIDRQNKQQSSFLKLDKTYRTTILFGISTDSYDLLGMPTQYQPDIPTLNQLDQILQRFVGDINQSYPPYSAVQVNGHPLYYWTRRNQLHTLKIPNVSRTIYSINKGNIDTLSNKYILNYANQIIPNIIGNFRQQSIMQAWTDLLTSPSCTYSAITLTIQCSSGTYIRSLAHAIGQELNLPALALSINRLQVGPYHLHQSIKLDPVN